MELLEIFNDSFLHADIPQFWRQGIIILILKAGKPTSDVDSYRPISLTSCMVKEDQIIRLVQKVNDGFQLKPHLCTVMTLFDYSKAYERTWRELLLQKMQDLGIPITITRWVAAFLRTRTAQVVINGTLEL